MISRSTVRYFGAYNACRRAHVQIGTDEQQQKAGKQASKQAVYPTHAGWKVTLASLERGRPERPYLPGLPM